MRLVLTVPILLFIPAASAQGCLSEASTNELDQLRVPAGIDRDQFDASTSWCLDFESQSYSKNVVVVAEADGLDQQVGHPYQQELDSILKRDDIAAAKEFVDALVDSPGVTPAVLRSMNDQIWRTKAERLIEYSNKFRAAIVASDLASMKDYSERMQRLTASVSSKNVEPSDPGETPPAETTSQPASHDLDEPPSKLMKPTSASALGRTEDVDPISQQMQTALKEDRLLPPAKDNAFDLAVARLAIKPGEATARDIIDKVIETRQVQIAAHLRNNQPERALELARQLFDALDRSEAEHSWLDGYRSTTRHGFEQQQPDVIAGLIGKCEEAIDQRDLTIASFSALPAYGYLDLLASLLGIDHHDVVRLAVKLIATYQELIGRMLAGQHYEGAMTLVQRVEPIALRFDIAVDEIQTLRRNIESRQARP